jgi:site-specific recombinase XerD
MKRSELIEKYLKLLHIKNYAPQTEKSYIHHLNLFIAYIKNAQIKDVNSKVLLDYFNILKQEKLFSYLSMKQSLAAIRFILITSS